MEQVQPITSRSVEKLPDDVSLVRASALSEAPAATTLLRGADGTAHYGGEDLLRAPFVEEHNAQPEALQMPAAAAGDSGTGRSMSSQSARIRQT